MTSIKMPDMFFQTITNTVTDKEATYQNLKYLLLSQKGEFFGDPYFGSNVRKFFYDQNDYILEDLVIDSIYTTIAEFMPQIKVNRNDIRLYRDHNTVTVYIKGVNQTNFVTDMYNIVLFQANN